MSFKSASAVNYPMIHFTLFIADATKKTDSNPLTEILKCPTKVVLLRVSCE